MNDIMLDLETLSVRPDAAIVVIGAVKFSRKGELPPLTELDTFYRRITIKSCRDAGLRIDEETLDWWRKQDKNVYFEALENPDRIPIQQALHEFADWIPEQSMEHALTKFGSSIHVWANGVDFDCTILGEAYTRCGMKIPWNFWNTRDVRTIFDLAGIKKYELPNNDQHHAIHDCYRQIVGVKRALKIFGNISVVGHSFLSL